MEKQAVKLKFAAVNWSKVLNRPRRPHDELLAEAEEIVEHVKHNAKKRKHDGKRI
jgi:hypothetical protein